MRIKVTRLRLVALFLVLVAVASVSFRSRRTFHVTDVSGMAVSPSYVVYGYRGARLNPVHSTTYRAGELGVARGDSSGRTVVPAAFHVHRPFPIESQPKLLIEMLYVPRLHNAAERFGDDGRAVIPDLSNDPQRWEGTLLRLSSIIRQLVSRPEKPPLREADPATAALVRELIGHFRNEYDAFLARYDNVARVRPEMPDHVRFSSAEEQRKWAQEIDAHLAREPRWGLLIRRVFGDDLKLYSRWENELQ